MINCQIYEGTETPYLANEEKREIFSVAIIQINLIYRNIQGESQTYSYTADTSIAKFQQNYFRTNANSGTNIDHAEFNTTEGFFLLSLWR
jgi:hypothetical protein